MPEPSAAIGVGAPRSIDRPGPVIAPRAPHIWGERHLAPVKLLTSVPGTVPNSIGARMTTSVQQHRALRLLADAPHGRTVADLLAHGFTNGLLDRLKTIVGAAPAEWRRQVRQPSVRVGLADSNSIRARWSLGRSAPCLLVPNFTTGDRTDKL
jgi:hypothetical protein